MKNFIKKILDFLLDTEGFEKLKREEKKLAKKKYTKSKKKRNPRT